MAVMFFIGNNGVSGSEPWRFDAGGSPVLLADMATGSASSTGNSGNFVEVNGRYYMTGGNGTNVTNVFDVTSGAPVQLTNFAAVPVYSSGASRVLSFNGQPHVLYFPPDNAANTAPILYSLQGGSASVVGAITSNPGGFSGYPNSFTELGGRLYYFSWTATGSNPWELWSIGTSGDGTRVTGGPADLRSLGSYHGMVTFNNAIYFVGTSAASGAELYKISNGVVSLVQEFNPGAAGSFDYGNMMDETHTVVFNNQLYFMAKTAANGAELYRITASGAVQSLGNLNPTGDFNPDLAYAVEMNGELYFAGNRGTSGYDLWKIQANGSPTFVAEVAVDGVDAYPFQLTNFNGTLYFSAHSAANGRELWKLDPSGTPVLVMDIAPGTANSNPAPKIVYNNALYFVAENATSGQELWRVKADGSVELVSDINPGTGNSLPANFALFDGKLYFTAYSVANGHELWSIDQTGAATMHELAPGTTSGASQPLVVLGNGSDNTAPTNITLSDASVREFAATGTDVGVLSAVDAQGGAMTYTLLNSAGGRFKLNGNTLEVDNGLLSDFEQDASHVVRVRVTDSGGLTYDRNLTVTLTNVATENITGDNKNNVFVAGSGNDRLNGEGGRDQLEGGSGNDILDGGALNDIMIGGNGNDTYYVNHAGDVTTETTASLSVGGDDLVYSSISHALASNIERLTLSGAADVNATGNTRNNAITGNNGDNIINGMTGNDSLTGDLGDDSFLFDTTLNAATNKDTITDFNAARDLILLDKSIFSRLVQALDTPLLSKYYWESSGGLAHDVNDRILYNTTTGELSYDADGNKAGGVSAITFAILTGAPNISQLDFIVV